MNDNRVSQLGTDAVAEIIKIMDYGYKRIGTTEYVRIEQTTCGICGGRQTSQYNVIDGQPICAWCRR